MRQASFAGAGAGAQRGSSPPRQQASPRRAGSPDALGAPLASIGELEGDVHEPGGVLDPAIISSSSHITRTMASGRLSPEHSTSSVMGIPTRRSVTAIPGPKGGAPATPTAEISGRNVAWSSTRAVSRSQVSERNLGSVVHESSDRVVKMLLRNMPAGTQYLTIRANLASAGGPGLGPSGLQMPGDGMGAAGPLSPEPSQPRGMPNSPPGAGAGPPSVFLAVDSGTVGDGMGDAQRSPTTPVAVPVGALGGQATVHLPALQQPRVAVSRLQNSRGGLANQSPVVVTGPSGTTAATAQGSGVGGAEGGPGPGAEDPVDPQASPAAHLPSVDTSNGPTSQTPRSPHIPQPNSAPQPAPPHSSSHPPPTAGSAHHTSSITAYTTSHSYATSHGCSAALAARPSTVSAAMSGPRPVPMNATALRRQQHLYRSLPSTPLNTTIAGLSSQCQARRTHKQPLAIPLMRSPCSIFDLPMTTGMIDIKAVSALEDIIRAHSALEPPQQVRPSTPCQGKPAQYDVSVTLLMPAPAWCDQVLTWQVGLVLDSSLMSVANMPCDCVWQNHRYYGHVTVVH